MQSLSKEFTCDGAGICPSFEWIDVPKETKSFVLTCNDPDAVSGNFIHLVLINIPAKTLRIDNIREIEGDFLPNSGGEKSYYPPCPPSGSHRYIFTLYALDIERIAPESVGEIETILKPHTVTSATITGIYARE
jgi:hypothetical protein